MSKSPNKRVESWRDSNNYRADYFNKNMGLLNCIYFCAYCGNPMTRKEVQVDHIIPPSAFSKRKYKGKQMVSNTSVLARALNSSFNSVSSCATCNRRKSNKIGLITARGVVAKGGEVAVSATQKVALAGVYGVAKTAWFSARIIAKPFSPGSPVGVKIGFAVLYAALIYFFIF